MKNPKWSNPKGKKTPRLVKGYWLIHGKFQNEATFLGINKKQALDKGDKLNKRKKYKGKIIKM